MENIKIILAMLIFPLLGTAGALAQTGKIAMDVSWDGTRCNHSHGLCTTSQSSNKNISESKFYAEKVNETTFR
ncbi:MAG: hypothetical protein LBE36_04820, partial [Flavobacteriaceae bacterium]|nr:hypothetical protein [Flavobacteriaceae bacterium]